MKYNRILLFMLIIGISIISAGAFNYYEDYSINFTNVVMYDNFSRNQSLVGNVTYPETGGSWHESPDGSSESDVPEFYTDGNNLILAGDGGTGVVSYLGNDTTLMILDTKDGIEWDMNVSNPDFVQIWFGTHAGGYIPAELSGKLEFYDVGSGYVNIFESTTSACNFNLLQNTWYHYKLMLNLTDGSAELFVNDTFECSWSLATPTNIFSFLSLGSGSAEIDNFIIYNSTESPYYLAEPPCIPDWECTLFGDCTANVSECLSVTDLNLCGEEFTGNLTDYDEACVVPPITGYAPAYGTGDIPVMTIDAMGKALGELIAMVGIIVIVGLSVWGIKKFKKGVKMG